MISDSVLVACDGPYVYLGEYALCDTIVLLCHRATVQQNAFIAGSAVVALEGGNQTIAISAVTAKPQG